jgi:predicted Zn-dependent protease with MMP-like domain
MSETDRWGSAPTLDDIAAMARNALETLEEPFRTHARAVAIKVEDFADEETLEAMKIDNPYELTGLYSGVALTLELHSAPSQIPPMVWLYRMPILDEWAAAGDIKLEELVAHVVIHELGHHFGWSDEEMHEALEED